MGGLISRYALKWMENNNQNHNTRLWISFDSPHKGANIPIGDQYFLDFFSRKVNNVGAKKAIDEQINSYAARQMLLHHYSANSILPAGAIGTANYRSIWQSTIDNLGYPNNLRKIAIVNGSINGTTTGQACQKVVEMQTLLKFRVYFFLYLGWNKIAASDINFTGNYGSACQVFKGWVLSKFNSNTKTAAAPAASKSFDIIPGGTFTAQKEITDQGGYAPFFPVPGFSVGTKTNFNLIREDHCFIPTKSALGMNISNTDLGENLYNRNLVCAGETPFQSYYAPTTNEEHITLTPQNVEWITKEIDGFPQPATANYNSIYPIILQSGSEPVCSPATYAVSNLPSGSSVIWSGDNNNIANVNQTTGTVTRTGNGTIILTAAVSSPCGSFSVARSIVVGTNILLTGTYSTATSTKTMQTVNFVPAGNIYIQYQWPGITNVSASLASGSPSGTGFYAYPGMCSFNIASGQNISINFNGTSSCGAETATRTFIHSSYSSFAMTASPNPASNNINVTISEVIDTTTDKAAKTQGLTANKKSQNITRMYLHDFNTNRLVKQWSYQEADKLNYNLNITDVKSGIYVLKMERNNKTALIKIVVQ